MRKEVIVDAVKTTMSLINYSSILSKIAFIASGIMSYLLVSTLCNTALEHALAIMITLVTQASSFLFFVKTIKTKEKIRFFYGALAVFLFSISILGTIAYQFAQDNNVKNESIKNSDEYNRQLQAIEDKRESVKLKRTTIINAIAQKETQLADTKNTYNNQIKQLETQRDSINYKSTWLTNEDRGKVQKKIDAKQTELAAIINQRNAEIDKLSQDLLQVKDNIDMTINQDEIQILETKGYLSLASAFEKYTDVDGNLFVLALQIAIAFIFETTAVGLHISSELSNKVTFKAKKEPKKEIAPKITPKKETETKVIKNKKKPTVYRQKKVVKNKIGFQGNVGQDFTQSELKRYKEVMLDEENITTNKNGRKVLGYKKIRDKAELSEGAAKNCFKHLQKENVIKVVGNQSYLV